MKDQQISSQGKLRKFFTILPNLYDDSGLDPYEFRLLAHYVRVGDCWESLRTTADHCMMSKSQVERRREALAVKGFIRFGKPTRYGTIHIIILDRWDENMRKYAGVPTRDKASLPEYANVPVVLPKKNQLRITNKENPERAHSSVRPAKCRTPQDKPHFQGVLYDRMKRKE